MGCWNGTCGVTNTPIHDGDETTLVFLRGNALVTGSGMCYPNIMYSPIAFAVHGRYNDYGGLKAYDTPINKVVCDMLSSYYTDSDMEPETDINTLIDDVCTDQLSNVSFMLVHSSVWYDLINHVGSAECSYQYFKNSDKTAFAEFNAGYESYIAPCQIAANYGVYCTTDTPNYFTGSWVKSMMHMVDKTLYKSEFLRKAAVDMCLFDSALSHSRKFWSPQSGAGSQDSDYDTLKIISYHVERLADEFETKYE